VNSSSPREALRRINRLGAASLISTAALTVLSPLLAGFTYFFFFFGANASHFPDRDATCGWCAVLASDANPFRQTGWYVPGTVLPMLVSTVAFLVLLSFLRRHEGALTEDVARRIRAWAMYFGLAALVAIPIFVEDFWLSVAWGRMAANGINPYYSDIPRQALQGIPIFVADQKMTYGPLWALIAAAVGFLSHGVTWIEFLLSKLVLCGFWFGSLHQLSGLLERETVRTQCIGMAVYGWLPLSFLQATGEGHNDIAMVFFLLCGLRALQAGSKYSTLSFVASAVVKYVTAPLLILDLLDALFHARFRHYLRFAFLAAMTGLCVFAIYYRSPAFFAPLAEMRSWRFMEPSTALDVLTPLAGPQTIRFLSRAVRVGWLILAAFYLFRYLRARTPRALNEAVLALLSAILFTFVGHVWPWFLIWVIAGSALAPGMLLARWVIGVAVLFPFVQVWWKISPSNNEVRYSWPATVIYLAALLWLAAGPLIREDRPTA